MTKGILSPMDDVEKVTKSLGWVRKVREYLKNFNPDLKSMNVNFRTRDCVINLSVLVPDDLRRKFLSVKIPAYSNFVITSVLDEAYNEVKGAWNLDNGHWKIKADRLPKSERFRITMSGMLSHYAMQKLVYAKSAANRDQSGEEEKYWLQAIIRDVTLVEKVYSELLIEDIDVKIKIDLEQYYALTIPRDIFKRIKVVRDWIKIGRETTNLRDLVYSWRKLQKEEKKVRLTSESLIGWVDKISSEGFLQNFFYVDAPFRLGNINPGGYGKFGLLENVGVEGRTDLTLNQPKAEGNLVFEKKKYQEEIKKALDDIS